MNDYWFEIKQFDNHRYGWNFMEAKGNQLRSLARSTGDFDSREDAEKAIVELKKVFVGAPVLQRAAPLPESRFTLHREAVPLVARQPRYGNS